MPAAAFIPLITGLGSSVISGVFGNKAIKSAAQTQEDAAKAAAARTDKAVTEGQQGVSGSVVDAQQGIGDAVTKANSGIDDKTAEIMKLLAPYIGTGTDSLSALKDFASTNGPLGDKFSFKQGDLEGDPGYQFTLQQGNDAIQKAAAARGGLFSSGTLKSIANFTTGTANTHFNDAFSRAKQTFDDNRAGALSRAGILQTLAGQGLSATGTGASALQTAGLSEGQNLTRGAEYSGDKGLQGSVVNANLGVGGAQDVGNWLTDAARAKSQGTIQSTNNWLKTVDDVGKTISTFVAGKSGGVPQGSGVGGGGVWDWAKNPEGPGY